MIIYKETRFVGDKYRIKRLHSGGTQGPNVSIYARGVLNSFLCALEGCLVNLELSEKLFIYLDVLGGTLVVTKVLGGFFVLSELLRSYSYGSGRKFEDMK